jgi:hypothetical protein
VVDDSCLLCIGEDVRPVRHSDRALCIVSQSHTGDPQGSRLLLKTSRGCQHKLGMRHETEKIEISKRCQYADSLRSSLGLVQSICLLMGGVGHDGSTNHLRRSITVRPYSSLS